MLEKLKVVPLREICQASREHISAQTSPESSCCYRTGRTKCMFINFCCYILQSASICSPSAGLMCLTRTNDLHYFRPIKQERNRWSRWRTQLSENTSASISTRGYLSKFFKQNYLPILPSPANFLCLNNCELDWGCNGLPRDSKTFQNPKSNINLFVFHLYTKQWVNWENNCHIVADT